MKHIRILIQSGERKQASRDNGKKMKNTPRKVSEHKWENGQ